MPAATPTGGAIHGRNALTGRALILTAAVLLTLACSTVSSLLASPTSTPGLLTSTEQVLSSSPTATEEPTDASTPTAANTEAVISSATPTPWLPPLYSLPTAPSPLSCKLNWQSPRNHVIYNAGDSFTVGWSVTNTGTVTWDPGSVEFTYVSGAKLYDDPLVRLKSSVAPGQSVVLSVAMHAPRNSTTYTTYWSLKRGDTFFCSLALWIYVQ